MDNNIEILKEKLNKIGWSIQGRYPNMYIFDHKNQKTPYRVSEDRVEVDTHERAAVCFHFKGSEIKEIENDAIALGTEACFILFMNHDLPLVETTHKKV